ncbi:hypothetical protein [Roseateles violae]|uniref:Uncharacterized protein n=1 Tax=Roseateles violae TaxID=3058042 RepID=A0ABT8DWP5_9BURK|nr:hypothetical protein [Pelomonas sp. PFR6]MDN3920641.1 hypothetical protein [Pelomonas sp. PFR6]
MASRSFPRSTRWPCCCLLALLSAPALAQDARWQPPTDPDSTHLSVTQSVVEPLATAGAAPNALQRAAELPAARQTMLWAERQHWALGVGVEQRLRFDGAMRLRPFEGQQPRDGGLVVGLALNTGPQTQLSVQTPLLPAPRLQFSPSGEPLPAGDGSRELRMGLEFRSTDRLKDLRRGLLMKVELSNQTTLALKPRAGKVGITLNKSW